MNHSDRSTQTTPRHLARGFMCALASAVTILSLPAQADSDHRMVPLLKSYHAECSACHMAYPPSMLGASAWRRTMDGLDHHFGSDASLDDATVTEISTWLQANACHRADLQSPPQDRITTSRWFVREHRKIASKDWANPKVGGASNCMACHQSADRYGFDEDNVRLPEGVGQRAWWHRGDDHD